MKKNFFKRGDRYYLRVSTITSALRGGFGDVPQDVIEKKAVIGTEVHDLCQRYALGEKDVASTNDRCNAYLGCFKKFCDKGLQPPTFCEERFFDDELGITGQIDLLCPIKGSKEHILFDLKTSASVEEDIWFMQGIIYAKMISEQQPDIQLADNFVFLQLKEKGNAKPIHFKNWKKEIPAVTSTVKDFINENKEILQEMLENELDQ